ncbi:MAG: hypothetical protein LBQ32_07040 [Burkholderiaceae bacterium]|nr:hypothetical protein [Burkholderiaceae bacterium]
MLLIAALLFLVSSQAYSQSKPPPIPYIDKGACPFECCTYQKWETLKTTSAYVSPDKNSRRIGVFKIGNNVVGLTGEVRTIVPGKFVIQKAHEKYKPGDVLWIYTPLGEGFYKVWFKGRMYEEEIPYISGPYETSSPSCEETPKCWGKLEKEMQVEWWVKIKSSEGWSGWTNQIENFGGMDACG